MPRLSIHLFGTPQFFLDETRLKLDRRKTLALLAFLACSPGEGRSRDQLTALLWPDATEEQAPAYLRQALWDFSKAAGEGWVERQGALVCLRQDAEVWVDVRAFEGCLAAWKSGDRQRPEALGLLEEAARLYTDDFLAGMALRDSPDFDDWQTLQAESLRLALGEALEGLARLQGARGEYEAALAAARRWLALDELNEDAHRALMQLYDASGQRSAALRQYETCHQRLQEDLGVEPELATLQLFQQISQRRNSASTAAAARPPARTASREPLPVYLPAQSTPFLGRESELGRIKAMLDNPECRLISLVGPGGSGKTRLAIETAGQSLGFPHQMSFPHGVYFAGLVNASTSTEALSSIASALKLGPEIKLSGEFGQNLSYETIRAKLLEFLAGKKILLVLDNLEQLVECASSDQPGIQVLADLLAAAPGLKLISTSRVRLNLAEEWVFEVGGLPYPEDNAAAPAGLTHGYAAVQLFLKSAARAAGFMPTDEDWPAIFRICRLVEGLPLGVELAAAWVKLLTCTEIADEIARDLDFLAAARPGIPERHNSLRAVFEHSWRLLGENERAVFRRLSIFRGGFTREAALQVAGASLTLLSALVDRSLLRRVSSGRFDLHELVKQYAAEKLAADPSAQAETEARHAQYYTGWLRQKGEQLRGREQAEALNALRGEVPNLRQAWRWLVQQRQDEQLAQVQADFILFHEMTGDYANGGELMHLLVDALRADPVAPQPGSLTAGLLGLGLAAVRHFKMNDSQLERFNRLQQESTVLARTLPAGPTRAFILMLNTIGPSATPAAEMVSWCQESAEIFQASGDPWGSGLAYLLLGDIAQFGSVSDELSHSAYLTSRSYFEQLGNDWGQALCWYGLAINAARRGNPQEGLEMARKSLVIYEAMGNADRAVMSRHFVGEMAATCGQMDEARRCFDANRAWLAQSSDPNRLQGYEEYLKKLGF